MAVFSTRRVSFICSGVYGRASFAVRDAGEGAVRSDSVFGIKTLFRGHSAVRAASTAFPFAAFT